MWVVDPDNHQIIEVNNAALSLYGYTKAEMLSLTTHNLRNGDLDPAEDPNNELARGTQKHITKGGDSIYVRITAHTIQIDGKRRQLFIVDEVTKQTRREQQLQTSQQLFKLIKEKLPLGLFVLDQKGNMLQWNSYKEDLSGYSSEEITDMHALDFFDPQSRPKVKQALQEVWQKAKGGEVEGDLLTKSGDKIPMLYKAHSVQIEGQQRLLGFGIDVSELKEAQQRIEANLQLLQAIIDQAKALIYIKDEEGRFQFVNEEFLSLFDLPADEVIGKRDIDIMDEKYAQPMQQSDKKVREGKGPLEREFHVNIGGNTHIFLTTKVLLQGIPGFENHVLGLSSDITKRKQMEEQLKKSAEQNQILLAEIHHRVKNNLAIVSGLLDLQVMETDSVELQDNLRDSQSRILSIASIHELLYEEQNFSSIRFDNNIKKLVQTIANTLSPDVTFQFSMDTVELDINQAITSSLIINEIVTNAIKHAYGEEDEAIIDITLREDEGTIFLTVRDYGKGLPGDFDHDQPKSLGLKLIQVLNKQLDGQLSISSKGGTTFELIFEKEAPDDSKSSVTNSEHTIGAKV